jgi:hypothetical protein
LALAGANPPFTPRDFVGEASTFIPANNEDEI